MSGQEVLGATLRPGMTSYALNAEDVVLRRLFAPERAGFYVDVGAGHPLEHSVTRHFYDRGWRGVNVPGDARRHDDLVALRPRDVTLRLSPASSPQLTLDDILRRYAPPEGVDLLRLAVPGQEGALLASTDWRTTRPVVVLVAATDTAGAARHEARDAALSGSGYRFGLFDGLNRFYCREEDAERLLPLMAAPANVLDDWRPAREVRLQEQLTACRARVAEQQESLVAERRASEDARSAFQLERDEHARTRASLQHLRASTSWRATAPFRDVSSLRRLMRSHTAS